MISSMNTFSGDGLADFAKKTPFDRFLSTMSFSASGVGGVDDLDI